MPVLDNTQWERFAQTLSLGTTQRQAALSAGYSPKSADAKGCKLAKRPEVAARIKELQTKAEHQVTKQVVDRLAHAEVDQVWIETMLMTNAQKGQEVADLSASNRAVELLAKLKGYMIERQEVNDMRGSIAERLAAARKRTGRAPIAEQIEPEQPTQVQ